MIVIQRNSIQEVQWPKWLAKNVVTMHIREQDKRLLCSPLASYLAFDIYDKNLVKCYFVSAYSDAP
jgi:hypothetical protein